MFVCLSHTHLHTYTLSLSFARAQRGGRRYSRRQLTRSSFGQVSSSGTLVSSSHLSPESRDSDDDESAFFIGAMETIALPSDDSDMEYFDAQGNSIVSKKTGNMSEDN